jgi:hypothetical protein
VGRGVGVGEQVSANESSRHSRTGNERNGRSAKWSSFLFFINQPREKTFTCGILMQSTHTRSTDFFEIFPGAGVTVTVSHYRCVYQISRSNYRVSELINMTFIGYGLQRDDRNNNSCIWGSIK